MREAGHAVINAVRIRASRRNRPIDKRSRVLVIKARIDVKWIRKKRKIKKKTDSHDIIKN